MTVLRTDSRVDSAGIAAGTAAGMAAVALALGEATSHLPARAAQIRQQLGVWPTPERRWRIVLAGSGADGTVEGLSGLNAAPADFTHLILFDRHAPSAAERARWIASGAAVLEVTPAPDGLGQRADLTWQRQHYALAGHPQTDWLAALAAFLACGCEPEDALCLAWGWTPSSEGDAWPTDPQRMPRVLGEPEPQADEIGFGPCPPLGLYPLVGDAQWVERLLDLGVKTVQLRIKADPSDAAQGGRIEHEIGRAVELGRAYQARVFINDHWRTALAAGAYGVHLGQEDLHTADLGALARAGIRLGLSTHGIYEMLLAWRYRPSYLAFGAVFPTQTKQLVSQPQGLARLSRFVGLFGATVPTVAIGGIDLARLPEVLATGVGSAAVVRAITDAAEPAAAVLALQRVFDECGAGALPAP